MQNQVALPMGLNRISWKPAAMISFACSGVTLPMGLNRISWKQRTPIITTNPMTLPMGLNRISWKLLAKSSALARAFSSPYRWV